MLRILLEKLGFKRKSIYDDRVFVLVGRSGAGKTTVMKALAERYGYNIIKSYTTRAPRNSFDTDHIFVDIKKFNLYEVIKSEALAVTYFDRNYYWINLSQIVGKSISLVALDPIGATALERSAINKKVHVIWLKVDRMTSADRLAARNDNAIKIIDRLDHDDATFKSFMCSNVIDTLHKSKEEVINAVHTFIKEINEKYEQS